MSYGDELAPPADYLADEKLAGGSLAEAVLIQCKHCSRKFRTDRIAKHEGICDEIRRKQSLRGVFHVHKRHDVLAGKDISTVDESLVTGRIY